MRDTAVWLALSCALAFGCGRREEAAAPAASGKAPAPATATATAPPPTAAGTPLVIDTAPDDTEELGATLPAVERHAAGEADTPVSHGRLSMTLPGRWTVKPQGDLVAAVPEGEPQQALMLLAPVPLGDRTLEELLPAAMTRAGATIVKKDPPEPKRDKTKAGAAYAYQAMMLETADKKKLIVGVIAVDVGAGAAQLLMLVAGDGPKLAKLANRVSPALAAATVAPAPGPAPASPPTAEVPGGKKAGGSVYATSGDGSATVAGSWEPESPELAPIGYKIAFQQHIGLYTSSKLLAVRDRAGRTFLNEGYWGSLTGPLAPEIFELSAAGLKGTGVSWASVGAVLSKQAKREIRVGHFTVLDLDADGNALVGVDLWEHDHDGYVVVRKGQAELAISPVFVKKLAKGDTLVHEAARMTADGSIWLVTHNQKNEVGMALASRYDEGKWMATSFVPTFPDELPAPEPRAIADGAVDPAGNWVFYSNGVVWRIDRKRVSTPLARLAIDARGVYFSPPLVLPNGDIWLAVTQQSDVVATSTPSGGTSTNFYFGDRSRLIRFRPDGKGKLVAGEIDGKELLERIRKSGGKIGYPNLIAFHNLRPDPASGGLLVYEGENGQLLVLVPTD